MKRLSLFVLLVLCAFLFALTPLSLQLRDITARYSSEHFDLFDEIIEKSSNNWDIMYIELSNWLENYNKYPSKNENSQLYSWVGSQRNRRKKNQLSNIQIKKLDSIEFIWNSHESTWEEMF